MGKYRQLHGPMRWMNIGLVSAGLLITVIYLFNIAIAGRVMPSQAYDALVIACFLPVVFLNIPASKTAPRDTVPWYDLLLMAASMALLIAIFPFAMSIEEQAWSINPPTVFAVLAVIQWVTLIEASRRAAGPGLAIIVALFSIYPLFASQAPGFLQARDVPFVRYLGFQFIGDQGEFGTITQTITRLIIGFLVFGIVMQFTGGGRFFVELASGLLGRVRGGTAKVAVMSSAMIATLTGSVISNIITTGCVTIPSMKKSGYDPATAASVEACASTGGQITPPVMGTAAFLIASFLGIPYASVCIAAAVPALIFYVSIFTQVDAYAARKGLKGIPKSECPSIIKTFKWGWFYTIGVALLIWFVFLERVEARAPYWASLFLIAACMIRQETRLNLKGTASMMDGIGRTISEIVAIIAPLGLVMGSLSITGSGLAFSSLLKSIGGESLPLLLLLAALASYILGMGLTVTACYVLLATIIVPALTSLGINIFAAHMFVFYLGLSSFITPPVALGAYAAAAIAGASPIRTGFKAMRLGLIMLILPFMFVLNPSLIMEGTVQELLLALLLSIISVIFLGAGLEGYLLKIGRLNVVQRALIFIAGLSLLYPYLYLNLVAVGSLLVVVAIRFVGASRMKRALPQTGGDWT